MSKLTITNNDTRLLCVETEGHKRLCLRPGKNEVEKARWDAAVKGSEALQNWLEPGSCQLPHGLKTKLAKLEVGTSAPQPRSKPKTAKKE